MREKLKKYDFRFKIYFLSIVSCFLLLILIYFLVPQIMNYPPYSEEPIFQNAVGSTPHLQQYMMFFAIFSLITIVAVNILYKDVFKITEKKKTDKDINVVREKCFKITTRVMIIQSMIPILVTVFIRLTLPDMQWFSILKLWILYTTLATFQGVISSFFTAFPLAVSLPDAVSVTTVGFGSSGLTSAHCA